MGNIGSSSVNVRRRHGNRQSHPHLPPPPHTPQPEISGNQYVFAAAAPFPAQYPNPNSHSYYNYPGYYPPAMPAVPLPAPYDHHHRPPTHMYPCGPVMQPPPSCVEYQKAVTIRNDVNLKKESLMVEPDEENPGRFIVSFTFDATVSGSITIMFFAKEGDECTLTPMKENIFAPVSVPFEQGLGQKFRRSCGTGMDLSMFEETELLKDGEMEVYPLAVKAESIPVGQSGPADGNSYCGATNSQLTMAVVEKVKNEYRVRVVKQILCVNGTRYELQEIYGIGNSVGNDFDGNDPAKECVICLSEPRDTTVLPCRHMCMCSGCAKVLRFQTNRCPICRQPVDRLLEIKVNSGSDD